MANLKRSVHGIVLFFVIFVGISIISQIAISHRIPKSSNNPDSPFWFSSQIGGNDYDKGWNVAIGKDGAIYVSGETMSSDFPTKNAFDSSVSGMDAFVIKINPDLTVNFSTYLGGSSEDKGYGIAVDEWGCCYVVGETRSTNFPTFNAMDPNKSGTYTDAFITKFNPDGTLNFSTYAGDSTFSQFYSVAIDSVGRCYAAGYASGNSIVILNSDGSLNNTVPGSGDVRSIALDPQGGMYITGTSLNVRKYNPDGSQNYSIHPGGSDSNWGSSIAVDPSGACYVAGYTQSTDFPMVNAFDSHYEGYTEGFVIKLNPDGSTNFSSYSGGTEGDYPLGVAVDNLGSCFFTGFTYSTNYPVINAFYPDFFGDPEYTVNGFLTCLKPDGQLNYSTYFGCSGAGGREIEIGANGLICITGEANDWEFPDVNPIFTPTKGSAFIMGVDNPLGTYTPPEDPNGDPNGDPGPILIPGYTIPLLMIIGIGATMVIGITSWKKMKTRYTN